MRIYTNLAAYQAQVALKRNEAEITASMQRLSTGFRINNAGDDPTGLGVSQRMTAQIQGYLKASETAGDAIAMLKTADAALDEIDDLIQRMRVLSVQSSSDTYTSSDRVAADTEYQALEAEITRIVSDTKWNTMGLLNGTGGASSNGTFKIQVGADSGMNITVSIGTMSTASNATLNDLAGMHVSVQASASNATTKIDLALADLAVARSSIGAYMNRLEGSLDNVLAMAQNLTDSRSRILDTDYAVELSQLAKKQIIQQASLAILAQANAQPKMVLQLLRSV